jgi:hypothetical protein
MPRIGGPGGPHVPPQAPAAPAAETQKTDFASKVAQTAATTAAQGTEAARAQTAKAQQQSQLVGKARDIARRLAKGALDQKDATREFVELVIEERLPHFKKKKKKKKDKDKDEKDQDPETEEERLEEAVTELIHRDPALAKRLQTQFKKLAAQKG